MRTRSRRATDRRFEASAERYRPIFLTLLLATLALPGVMFGQDAELLPGARLAPALAARLDRSVPTDTVPIIVEFRAEPAPSGVPGDLVPRLQIRSVNAMVRLDSARDSLGDQLKIRERLWVVPAVVVFCGGNDINRGKEPQAVAADFARLAGIVQAELPGVPMFYISMGFLDK